MPYWYFDKEQLRDTPSRRDGVDSETERRYRRETAQFIRDLANLMSLGYSTIHTASVLMHRFYMFYSFRTFPRFVVGCSSLFLAGKVEETPKKCRDIIRKAAELLSPQRMVSFGDDPKEEILTIERIMLKTIKFDLQVDHPYRFLIEYAKVLKSNGNVPKEQVVQKAWNFINDSLATTLYLQWEPEIIAVAMVYLACKISKYDVIDWVDRTPEHTKWWDMYVMDMTKTILDEICHQVLDLYQNPTPKIEVPCISPPQLAASKNYKNVKPTTPPPSKRQKIQQDAAGISTKVAGNHQIPVKVSSNQDINKTMTIVNNHIHHSHTFGSYPSTSYQNPPLPGYASAIPPLPPQSNHHQKPPLPPQQPPLPPARNVYPINHTTRYPNSTQYYTNQPPPPSHNKNNRSNNYYHH
ncbi:hypothetical protein PVAND_010689 [Polypedilum vanderplanki]|uniref:Cyclin-like domain-containing protein n=1 Tax=Polypedilum vanderplanki TaxID=319348 RepID=A0A9J6CI37_POLVA|nr:hypothetical protein PVAND_010689 [Polypedilum vanderplanki]